MLEATETKEAQEALSNLSSEQKKEFTDFVALLAENFGLSITITLLLVLAGIGLIPQPVEAEDNVDEKRAIVSAFVDNAPADLVAALSGDGGHGIDQVGTGDGGAGGPNPEGTPVAQITLHLNTDGLHVRNSNSLNSTVMKDVLNGEQVTFNFAQTSSNGEVWWNITTNDGVTGWIAKNVGGTIYITNDTPVATPEAVGAPLAPTNSENATATAEAPAILTFQTASGENITATPIPSGSFDQAPTPPPSDVIQEYSTPDGRRFGLAFGDNNSPKYEFKDGEWKYVESSRQIYERLLPGRSSDILLQRYPDLRWDSEYGMYRFADGRYFSPGLGDVEGGDNYQESDLENGPQKFLFEFNSEKVDLSMRVFISDHHERIADMNPILDETRIERILNYYLTLEPRLAGKCLSITIAPSSGIVNLSTPLPPRVNYELGNETIIWEAIERYHYSGALTPEGSIWHVRLWVNSDVIDIQSGMPEEFAYEVFSGTIGVIRRYQVPGKALPEMASTLLFTNVLDADFYSEMIPLFGVEEIEEN